MKKHRPPEQWQALVDQQRDSGLSATQFCKQEGVGYASFCNWRKRLFNGHGDSAGFGEAGFLDLSSLMGAFTNTKRGACLGNGVTSIKHQARCSLLELWRKGASFSGHQTPRLRWQYYHLGWCPESLNHYAGFR